MERKFDDSEEVAPLNRYCQQALKLAEITFLGEEGYIARIPGFRGLLATGATKKEARAELETALVDWINLALAHNEIHRCFSSRAPCVRRRFRSLVDLVV